MSNVVVASTRANVEVRERVMTDAGAKTHHAPMAEYPTAIVVWIRWTMACRCGVIIVRAERDEEEWVVATGWTNGLDDFLLGSKKGRCQ
jgi:hypothetical protein